MMHSLKDFMLNSAGKQMLKTFVDVNHGLERLKKLVNNDFDDNVRSQVQ